MIYSHSHSGMYDTLTEWLEPDPANHNEEYYQAQDELRKMLQENTLEDDWMACINPPNISDYIGDYDEYE